MFIQWNSDENSNDFTGFSASWTSVEGSTVTPVADFSVSDLNPAYGIQVAFTDESANEPFLWDWNFGDGNSSISQHPVHTYTTPGALTVTLTAANCGGEDVATQVINVQQPPVMIVSPTNIDVTLGCGQESFSTSVSVSNHGLGDLVYNIDEWEYAFQGEKPNILALTYGVDLSGNYNNTVTAITTYFSDYTLTTTTATTADALEQALVGKNIFLMAKPEGDPAIYLNYAQPLQDFVNKGGTVIICGTTSGKANCIFNTGLLEGDYIDAVTNDPLDVVVTSHPITEGLGSLIESAPKKTYAYTFTGNDMQTLIENNGATVVGVTPMGLGQVVFIGFDYQELNDTSSRVIGQTVGLVDDYLVADWVTITPDGGATIDPSGEVIYTLNAFNPGLPAGNYQVYFVVYGNDPDNPVDTVWLNVDIESEFCASFIADQQCEGNVCFTDSVIGGATSVSYNFGDGSTSTQEDPCHVYTASGNYTVTLIACGSFGCDTLTSEISVNILSASISTEGTYIENSPISFFANSSDAESYSWDFGDGATSSEENPVHTYSDDAVYTVTLTVTDANGCEYTTTFEVDILGLGAEGAAIAFDVSLYPNPAAQVAYVEYSLPSSSPVQIELWNALGQKVSLVADHHNQPAGRYVERLPLESSGNYFVKLTANGKTIWLKLESIR
jgi:PKD repeat protein